jgi:hypothetical protein
MRKIESTMLVLLGVVVCLVGCDSRNKEVSSSVGKTMVEADSVFVVGFSDQSLDPKLVRLIAQNMSDLVMPMNEGVPLLDGFIFEVTIKNGQIEVRFTEEFWEFEGEFYKYKNPKLIRKVLRRLEG